MCCADWSVHSCSRPADSATGAELSRRGLPMTDGAQVLFAQGDGTIATARGNSWHAVCYEYADHPEPRAFGLPQHPQQKTILPVEREEASRCNGATISRY